ncbi:extracellular solute-binding protein [Candidatus Collierbacteria bacterium]|nr:extracellular solute-binding protein [Candidatus Collierbacteria bacterium]
MPDQFPLPPGNTDSLPPLPPQPDLNLPPPAETPPAPPNYTPPTPATTMPVVRPNLIKIIIPIIVGLAVISLVIFLLGKLFSKKNPGSTSQTPVTTITYWGLWESPAIMRPVIEAFEKENPSIKVNYQMQSHQDYQDRLKTAISGTTPPDVTRLHSSWLPLFYQDLLPAPANTVSTTELKTNFFPVAIDSVMIGDKIYGIPLTAEGLALFINSDIYAQKNLQPPTTWYELRDNAKALTERDPNTGKISRSGVALGNTSNVAHWPDLVSLMLLQNGVNLLSPEPDPTKEALGFYTSFAGPGKFWDETLPDSIIAFANEKVAMIFAPSWRISEITTLNPQLKWQIAPVPQLPETDKVNWASLWIETVPKNSKNPQAAWKFLSFLSSAKAQQLLYDQAVKDRGFSQVPANQAASQVAEKHPLLGTFSQSLPSAKTFYTASLTHDAETALNSRLIKYLEDAVNSLSQSRGDADQAVQTLILGFNQVLSQYNLVTALPSPATP